MRGMSWLGADNAAVVIRSHRIAARLSALRVSWPVSSRVTRRSGLSVIAALAAVALPTVPASSATATGWTQQSPATSPPGRLGASMAYDAATRNVVLFGGLSGITRGDTWTWDGSTWTKQRPATSPPARYNASMAYDAATGNVVLFGGLGHRTCCPSDTWVWDGSTWTKQAPAAHPPGRLGASMAY